MIETKTNKAISLLRSGDLKEALKIIRTFKIGFTREQKRAIEIASETLNGHGNFYHQLGIDTSAIIANVSDMLIEKYL